MRIADALTGLRIIIAPIVVWLILCDERTIAYYFFALAGITDTLDGYFARRSKKVATYGETFDASADSILALSTVITLAHKGEALFLLTIMIIVAVFWTPIIAFLSKKAGRFIWPHLDTNLMAAAAYPTFMANIIRWKYAVVLDVFLFIVMLFYMWKYIVYMRGISQEVAP